MPDHPSLKVRIETAIDDFLAEQSLLLTDISGSLNPLVEQSRVAVTGGKRLRAAFCYWGWRAARQVDCGGIVKAAAAMELVHAAAIVHDDIIDASAIRRGGPTAHMALRGCFADEATSGAGGVSLGILVGDLLISWAGQLFWSCGLPAAYLSRARPLWATLTRELIAGEFLEVLNTGKDTDVEAALEIIRLKSAKYTIERPMHLGGVLAGASPGALAAFSDYGIPLGEAFQLRDDLLGVFGNPQQTGKSNLDDLMGRKPTVLLSLTRAAAGAADRRCLEDLCARDDLDGDGAEQVRDIMERTGARKRVEEMIDQRVEKARAVMDRTRFPVDSVDALKALALIAAQRSD